MAGPMTKEKPKIQIGAHRAAAQTAAPERSTKLRIGGHRAVPPAAALPEAPVERATSLRIGGHRAKAAEPSPEAPVERSTNLRIGGHRAKPAALPAAPMVDTRKGYHTKESLGEKSLRRAESLGKSVVKPVTDLNKSRKEKQDDIVQHKDSFDKMSLGRKIWEGVKHPFATTGAHTAKGQEHSQARLARQGELGAISSDPNIQANIQRQNPAQLWKGDYDKFASKPEGDAFDKAAGIGEKALGIGTKMAHLSGDIMQMTGINGVKDVGQLLSAGGDILDSEVEGLHNIGDALDETPASAGKKEIGKNVVRAGLGGFGHGNKAKGVEQTADKVKMISDVAGAFNAPGASAVGGVADAVGGLSHGVQGSITHHKMGKLLDQNTRQQALGGKVNADHMKIARQARAQALIDQKEGYTKAAVGATNAVVGGLVDAGTLGAGETGAQIATQGVSTAVGKFDEITSDAMHRNLRHDVLEEEFDLTEKAEEMQATIKAQTGKDVTLKEARQIALKKAGYASGKKKEAFMDVTMNRAYKLAQEAEGDTPESAEAKEILSGMGLTTEMFSSQYNRQEIAEKLGVSGDWREEMQATQESADKQTNPFDPYKARAEKHTLKKQQKADKKAAAEKAKQEQLAKKKTGKTLPKP